MTPDTLKIIFIFVSLVEAVVMGLIPVYSKRFSESPKILGIANAFSGGVFLSIALMHIMPEQAATWVEIQEDPDSGITTKFPLPFFLMVSGYTLILVIDKVLFDTHVILEDGHGHKENEPGVLRRSITNAIRQSMAGEGAEVRVSQV